MMTVASPVRCGSADCAPPPVSLSQIQVATAAIPGPDIPIPPSVADEGVQGAEQADPEGKVRPAMGVGRSGSVGEGEGGDGGRVAVLGILLALATGTIGE
jgi:hypothetical protein